MVVADVVLVGDVEIAVGNVVVVGNVVLTVNVFTISVGADVVVCSVAVSTELKAGTIPISKDSTPNTTETANLTKLPGIPGVYHKLLTACFIRTIGRFICFSFLDLFVATSNTVLPHFILVTTRY